MLILFSRFCLVGGGLWAGQLCRAHLADLSFITFISPSFWPSYPALNLFNGVHTCHCLLQQPSAALCAGSRAGHVELGTGQGRGW